MNFYYKYRKWNSVDITFLLLTLIGLVIAVLGIILANSNKIEIDDSNLTNSPIIQGSSNFNINYHNLDKDSYSPYYQQGIYLNLAIMQDSSKYDFYKLKFVLPDKQNSFIPEVKYNTTYLVGNCNNEMNDCYVVQKFREPIKEQEICWIYTTYRSSSKGSDTMLPNPFLASNGSECAREFQ